MGGNALKNCTTRRYEKDEYFKLKDEVVAKFHECERKNRRTGSISYGICVIPAYRNKESFGDMDLIVPSYNSALEWEEKLVAAYNPKEHMRNGNVISLEYKEFQLDFIITPLEEFESSAYYFSYNDLGNLLGRIAHSMGLKLGHDGLSYNWRVDTYQFKNVVLLRDFKDILPVLGLSYERYVQGFDTLEDIFKFVVSSPFFNKDIYLLHNRNNAARTRDRKRKTYTEFLEWIESYEETPEQILNKKSDGFSNKDAWLPYLFDNIYGFEDTYNAVQKEWEEEKRFKSLYSGDIVRQLTGLEGKELGAFMKWHREYYGDKLKIDVLKLNPELIPRWIEYFVDKWKCTLTKGD